MYVFTKIHISKIERNIFSLENKVVPSPAPSPGHTRTIHDPSENACILDKNTHLLHLFNIVRLYFARREFAG